ncbi:MAG: hypothetical protein E4H36_12765 [Spirochaetales bacterium]|nr:MAG: hypothetical protein E4H36_12765 [Spirochaetales bacterium]
MSNIDLMRCPLRETAKTAPTDIWDDSYAFNELKYAIENGAVGRQPIRGIVRNLMLPNPDK